MTSATSGLAQKLLLVGCGYLLGMLMVEFTVDRSTLTPGLHSNVYCVLLDDVFAVGGAFRVWIPMAVTGGALLLQTYDAYYRAGQASSSVHYSGSFFLKNEEDRSRFGDEPLTAGVAATGHRPSLGSSTTSALGTGATTARQRNRQVNKSPSSRGRSSSGKNTATRRKSPAASGIVKKNAQMKAESARVDEVVDAGEDHHATKTLALNLASIFIFGVPCLLFFGRTLWATMSYCASGTRALEGEASMIRDIMGFSHFSLICLVLSVVGLQLYSH
ncbi:unnamed protein product [Amoebophrya sp. A120]|nr:unnamed protein product [Amoebophrya sp. A120]|eukprot:GSA120T00010841001.1